MIAATVALLFVLYLIIYCYKNAFTRPPNFPPGPPSLPVYGAFWIVLAHGFTDLAEAFRKLGQRYNSKLLGMYLGPVPTIVLNDSALIKEMLNREEFDGRMDIILFRLRSYWKKLGIFFTDGYFWHVQRRFSLRYLRDYGFGRRSEDLEAVIASEIKEMIDMRVNGPKYPAEQKVVDGQLVYLPFYLAVPFINGICHVLSRMTLPREHYPALWTVAEGALLFQRSSNDIGGALSLTPWLKDVMPNYSGYNDLVKGNQCLLDFFQKMIKEVMETHDESHDRHFLDMYITKMKEEQRTKDKTTYSVDQLVLTCTDYMFPAASAVQSTLTMLIERMLLQPEIQDRIHEEIDRVVGRDRLPTLDDRKNMPYTEACLREGMRLDTLVPLGVPHRALKDSTIAGYDVPEADPLKHEEHNESAWRLSRDNPAIRAVMISFNNGAALEDDVKSEPEDEFESADEDMPETGLPDLPLYIRQLSEKLDANGAWKELATRMRIEALSNWFAIQESPTAIMLNHVRECRETFTSKSLVLMLEDMGQHDAANIVRGSLEKST